MLGGENMLGDKVRKPGYLPEQSRGEELTEHLPHTIHNASVPLL